MDERMYRWQQLGVWLPALFVAIVTAVAVLILGQILPDIAVVLFVIALTAAGAVAFSSWVFRVIASVQRETERRAKALVAINQASLALSSELDLASVLQRVVDLSREVVNARYGALALVSENGEIEEFLTSGLSLEARSRIGALPQGKGLLGAVIGEGEIIRVERIADDARSSGFPPNHPKMTSFIGLPILYEGRVMGDLYLTDKDDGLPFTDDDVGLLRTFAAHAAIAIENARLYRQVQDLAVLEERDRIGMDLHDGVIQSLYATGLKLESSLEEFDGSSDQAREQIEQAIDNLNQTIADIRSYILRLRPAALAGTDLAGAVGALLQDLKVNSLLEVNLIEEPGAGRGLSEEQTEALYHVARESLTNVRKHAEASGVTARLEQQDGIVRLSISDDGTGFDATRPAGGQGLRNMRERVEALRGRMEIKSSKGKGTRLAVEVPVSKEREP